LNHKVFKDASFMKLSEVFSDVFTLQDDPLCSGYQGFLELRVGVVALDGKGDHHKDSDHYYYNKKEPGNERPSFHPHSF
jgi:hypothetical protein